MKEKIVMPGDQLSTSEELLPGEGTFEEDGIIRAAIAGEYIVDEKYRKAKVKPATSVPVLLKKGDIVIAQVAMVKTSMVIANVIHVTGKNRSVSGDTNGTIHVKEIGLRMVSFSSIISSSSSFFPFLIVLSSILIPLYNLLRSRAP